MKRQTEEFLKWIYVVIVKIVFGINLSAVFKDIFWPIETKVFAEN
jgi:hypothetical protein